MIGSDRDVGRVVMQLRGEKTQQALADTMRERGWRWSQATVWSVEKGERPLKLREAAVLSSVLGTTIDTLLRGDSGLVLLSDKLSTIEAVIAALERELREREAEVADTEARLQLARQEHVELRRELHQLGEAAATPENSNADEVATAGDQGVPRAWLAEEYARQRAQYDEQTAAEDYAAEDYAVEAVQNGVDTETS